MMVIAWRSFVFEFESATKAALRTGAQHTTEWWGAAQVQSSHQSHCRSPDSHSGRGRSQCTQHRVFASVLLPSVQVAQHPIAGKGSRAHVRAKLNTAPHRSAVHLKVCPIRRLREAVAAFCRPRHIPEQVLPQLVYINMPT